MLHPVWNSVENGKGHKWALLRTVFILVHFLTFEASLDYVIRHHLWIGRWMDGQTDGQTDGRRE